MKTKSIARVFADVGGYYVCDDSSNFLDTRGCSYRSKAQALRAAYESGYTHAVGSGSYRQNGSIRGQIRVTPKMEAARALLATL